MPMHTVWGSTARRGAKKCSRHPIATALHLLNPSPCLHAAGLPTSLEAKLCGLIPDPRCS